MKTFLVLWLAIFAVPYAAAADIGATEPGVIEPGAQPGADYRIQPTDVLSISVYEHPDLVARTRVSSDLTITFPLIGKIEAAGLTVRQLEFRIKELLEADYLVNAQVSVFIEAYHPRQVTVVGEVAKPGTYPLPEEQQITFLEAIALAGGFTKDAALNHTQVIRRLDGKREIIPIRVTEIVKKRATEKNIVIVTGDIIYVPESFF